jgi:TolB-like protein/Flp pilus assembly protein TadD
VGTLDAPALRLSLLGRFECTAASGAVDLRSAKDRALLAFLAMTQGVAQSRDRLAGLLWSDTGGQQARNSLKQALMRLRQALGPAADRILQADRRSIGLDVAAVDVDALALERLARQDSIDALVRASGLYRGPFLDDLSIGDCAFEEWLLMERQRLREVCERALSRVMKQALAADSLSVAAEAAKQMLTLDPLNEQGYRTLMLVHADEAQSLRLYEMLRERLNRELGIQPEPATDQLYDEIRRKRASVTPATISDQAGLLDGLRARVDKAQATRPSIAVLPFDNLSDDPGQQYFSDGITDDIITELSRFRTLFVIARHSSFQYRSSRLAGSQIGQELGVRYLADGSVRRIGDRIRVTARLMEAGTGATLWADRFDRAAGDIIAVQDDIVQAIATTLGYRIEAAGRERALHLRPDALTAYDLVLRSEGLFFRFTREDNAEARRLAEQAVALDTRSSLAHTQLGWTHCLDFVSSWVADRAAALDAAFNAARRAVVLDDADCRARWLLGKVHIYRREFTEARAQLRRAIALNPNDVEARGIYGFLLIAVGEIDAALEQFDIARRQNPFEFDWMIWYRGIALFTARRYDEAIATLKQVGHASNEVRFWLAACYGAAGHREEARAALDAFLAVAERQMAGFPGRSLAAWAPHFHGPIEYRDEAEFDHLHMALRAAGMT